MTTTLQMIFQLSAPARRALAAIASPQQLELMAERFYDTLQHERYRDFSVTPTYYTTAHGHRKAQSLKQVEQREAYAAVLTLKTLQRMKKLTERGLSITWLMEEILYFGFCRGMI
ncbi:MAG TPA: hypothetical protein PLY93_02645 [Turneriella sp.]|nr:hypothetical protein [Turneriella sp.]